MTSTTDLYFLGMGIAMLTLLNIAVSTLVFMQVAGVRLPEWRFEIVLLAAAACIAISISWLGPVWRSVRGGES